MSPPTTAARAGFRHEAFLYSRGEDYADHVARFVVDGLTAGERVMVALRSVALAEVSDRLGTLADEVTWVDMAELGSNPARILPAWVDFVEPARERGRPVRGVGEPAWPGRTEAELDECHVHEALLDVVFGADDDSPPFWLMCPYDAVGLAPASLERAAQTHPWVGDSTGTRPSPSYSGIAAQQRPLSEVPADATRVKFGPGDLSELRELVAHTAGAAGLELAVSQDLTLSVNEIATNSIRYGGGAGELRLWVEPGWLVCELADHGLIHDPLVGRLRPPTRTDGGRGVWLANQLCDLVQLRTSRSGTVVRLYMRRPG